MAETFVALRRGPGGFEQRVCLKRILPHLASDPELIRLFDQEARLCAQLSHANVVQLLDYTTDGERPSLVFELIDGTDLRQLHRARMEKGQPLTTGLVAHVGHEVASALSHAHERGVIHRDVSPSNVLLSLAGEVKLTDFGIAKAFFGTPGLTRSGAVKGKVPYIAPEYARTGVADPRADQFSLGVMLYELLTGEAPFRGSSQAMLHQIVQGDIPSPRRLNPSIPAALETICLHAMAFKPSQRYPTAGSLADDLDCYLNGGSIRARPVSAWGRLQRWCDRHRWIASLLAMIALLVVCLTVGGWIAAASIRTAYEKTLKSNEQLGQAVQASNASFELSQETLQTIVGRARDELYNVPQATQLVVQMSRDSAALQRRLLALRPDDLGSAQALVDTLDYLADAEWTLGDIDKSRAVTDELEALLVDARKRHPNHFDFETAWCSLLIERVTFPTPGTTEERQITYAEQMDQALADLQARFPDRAAVAKLAMEHAKCEASLARKSKDDARLLSASLKAFEAAEKLVELSPAEEKERSALWQAQTAQVLGYYYLNRERWVDAESWFARATRSMEANPLLATDREAKYFAAIIALGYGKAHIGAGKPSSASAMLDLAVDRFAKLVTDFPEDAKYRMDWIESLLARAELRWSQKETEGATVDWHLANEQFPQLSGSSVPSTPLEPLQSLLESLRARMQE